MKNWGLQMAKYRIEFKKKVIKFLESRNRKEQERLLIEIYKLPFGSNILKMKNHKNRYRLRVGDYRIIYEKYEDKLLIIVIEADSRGDIY